MDKETLKNQFETKYELYGEMLYKIAFLYFGNSYDAEDALQEVFIKLLYTSPAFKNAEHEKAWLIRVAANHCKDVLRFRLRHPQIPIDVLAESLVMEQEQQETLTELFELPVKQRTVIYLYYVEGYQMKEIADILGISVQSVKKRMQRGREQLRVVWKEECCR